MATISNESNVEASALAPQNLPEETDAPRYSRRETLLTMAGVLLVMLLASLDQTIVSTAMPHVISDLQGFDRYTWVTTAYLLTSTVMVPIYGKLSDLFGRKSIFLVGVILFLIGSALSGAAQTMNQLIAFRAFQGLGAAALMPIAIAVIGDLFSPRERGKWQGLTGGVFGISSILGPAAGGWITENTSWRWVFYVNLPIGIIALIVLIFLMPALRSNSKKKISIDYIGATLLIVATVPLLLGFTWAGSTYPWLSPETLGIFGGSLLAFIIFVVYEAYLERHDRQPIIDPSLFKNRIFSVSVIVTMITGVGMFGSIFFIPLYAQGVLNISATNSGLLLSPLMIALIAASILSGQLVSRFGKYKWIAILGMIITVAGSALFLRLDVNSAPFDLTLAMIVLGLGIGFSMALYTVIVQNALPNNIGQATSGITFFRSIGGTIALAAMGSVMTSAYQPAFHDAFNSKVPSLAAPIQSALKNPTLKPGFDKLFKALDNPNILLSADAQTRLHKSLAGAFGPRGAVLGEQLYHTLMDSVKVGLTQGLHNAFVMSFVTLTVGLVLVFFLKEIPLRGGRNVKDKKDAISGAETTENVSAVALH